MGVDFYIKQKQLKINDKIKKGIFVAPQFRELIRFEKILSDLEKSAQMDFKYVVKYII